MCPGRIGASEPGPLIGTIAVSACSLGSILLGQSTADPSFFRVRVPTIFPHTGPIVSCSPNSTRRLDFRCGTTGTTVADGAGASASLPEIQTTSSIATSTPPSPRRSGGSGRSCGVGGPETIPPHSGERVQGTRPCPAHLHDSALPLGICTPEAGGFSGWRSPERPVSGESCEAEKTPRSPERGPPRALARSLSTEPAALPGVERTT